MNIRRILKSLMPPLISDYVRKLRVNTNEYKGDYKNWGDVMGISTSFQENAIFEKVKWAATQVKEGKAAYERDSVLFNKIIYTWPVLACLQNAALTNQQLHVIDFGGSLGTSYFQNRLFLQKIPSLKWFIVEQKHYVDCGKKEFEDGQLQFEYSIDNVLEKEKVNCLLVSGSIQYFENPFEWFDKFIAYNFNHIIFDRISFIDGTTRLTQQVVPEHIYPASFPCWFFNEEEFINAFTKTHMLVADFNSADESVLSSDNKKLYWKGFYFRKNDGV